MEKERKEEEVKDLLWFRNWGIETKDDEVTGIWILDFGGDNIRWSHLI